MVRKFINIWSLLVLSAAISAVFGQIPGNNPWNSDAPSFNPETDITFKIGKLPGQAELGKETVIELNMNVPEGFHITSNMFSFDSSDKSFTVNSVQLPKGEESIVGEVIGGELSIKIAITLLKKADKYSFDLGYQACSEGENPVCFAPISVNGEFSINAKGTSVITGTGVTEIKTESEVSFIDRMSEKLIKALDTNIWFALAIIFFFGILTSLTPCVYPVIPLTMAFIGASTSGDEKPGKLKPFILSVFLVLGISITYSVLGVLAGLSGSLFGQTFQNPIFIGIFSLFFILLALSMFGFYDVILPYSLTNKLQVSKKGHIGALLVGMGTGILAAPCAGPIVAALLTWIGNTRSIAKGFIFMFAYAMGMGLLFIVIGTFTGVINSMPKSGNWMNRVKYFFGVLFVLAAALFAKPYLGNMFWVFILIGGVIPFILGVSFKYNMKILNFKSALLFVALSAAVFIAPQMMKNKNLNTHNGPGTIIASSFEKAISDAVKKASDENKTVLIDFYADWCAACKELDEFTWVDSQVKSFINDNAIMLKLDFTKTSKESAHIQQIYGVKGLPTVIFLDSNGKEKGRFVGFLKADKFLEIAEQLK